MGDQPDGIASLQAIARPTTSLSRDEAKALDHMCEVVKAVAQHAATRMVWQADGKPCLQSCSADGTPITVSDTAAVALPSGRVIRRSGKSAHEFLVTSEFIRLAPVDGSSPTCFVVTEPTPLTHGKAVDRIVEACRNRWKTLRQRGHRGGALQHYSFDRCGIEKLGRRMKQWHAVVEDTFEGSSSF